jgi:flagellar motility protein MotE (MotC chaperone)
MKVVARIKVTTCQLTMSKLLDRKYTMSHIELDIGEIFKLRIGKLASKTAELRETNKSIVASNNELNLRTAQLDIRDKNLFESNQELVAANKELTEANKRLAETNKHMPF